MINNKNLYAGAMVLNEFKEKLKALCGEYTQKLNEACPENIAKLWDECSQTVRFIKILFVTVFSTMICPECGKRLVFESHGSYVIAYCPTKEHYSAEITVIELCGIINHNGLNSLITPYVPLKSVYVKANDDSLEEPEPPDGFKIKPVEKE